MFSVIRTPTLNALPNVIVPPPTSIAGQSGFCRASTQTTFPGSSAAIDSRQCGHCQVCDWRGTVAVQGVTKIVAPKGSVIEPGVTQIRAPGPPGSIEKGAVEQRGFELKVTTPPATSTRMTVEMVVKTR